MGLVWRPAMATGLRWQDEQHKEMLRQINLLLEAMEHNQGSSVVKEMFEFLEKYSIKHFQDEEEYMQTHNCSTCKFHKKCHGDFKENLAAIKATFERQGASTLVVMKLHKLLGEWLINHILSVDKEMIVTSTPDPVSPESE